jgi:hypothetical protein
MEEVVIQDPETAESAYMPRSAIAAVTPDYLGTIEGIADYIIQIAQQKKLINYIKNEYDSLKKNSNRVYCLRNGTF